MVDQPDNAGWMSRLRHHWTVEGDLHALDGEYDLNFRVGGSAILKVMRPDCDPALVEMQIAALQALTDAALTPEVIPTRNGTTTAIVTDDDNRPRIAWMLTALSGKPYATIRPHSSDLIRQIGAAASRMTAALKPFDHPALDHPIKWNLCAPLWAREHLDLLTDVARRHALAEILETFAKQCAPVLETLPVQAIHNDLNDYNILARTDPDGTQHLTGLIDFGDMVRAPVICDLAIAGAYIVLDQPHPIEALAQLVESFCTTHPLTGDEIEILWPLSLTRLAVSALNAAHMQKENPDDPYVMISQAPINRFFSRLPDLSTPYIQARLRSAAGQSPVFGGAHIAEYIARHSSGVGLPQDQHPVCVDLGVTGNAAPQDPLRLDCGDLTAGIERALAPGTYAIGHYAEPRLIYTAPGFYSGDHVVSDRRTVHMAVDVFLPAGTELRAPLDGTVHSVTICPEPLGYGGVLTLRHETTDGIPFFTLYGHLAHDIASRHTVGDAIRRGGDIATYGSEEENGGWTPHIHVQIGLFDLPGADWPGVANPDEWDTWKHLCPDPAALVGLTSGFATAAVHDTSALRTRRENNTTGNLKLSYRDPVTILRGWKNILFDDRGRPYLDAYNNVPHVGHAHPRITEAVTRQMRLVNTNTRYLQPVHEAYIEALTQRLPAPLDVCFLLSSASEANELALRLARTFTGAKDTIVSASGYHGHTCAAIDISDYKFSGPGGEGRKDWVHVAPNPDTYRGAWQADDPDAGTNYAAPVADIIADLKARDRQLAAFISEPFPSVAGQLVPPPGHLKAVYAHVRAGGGICIADEVQTGLGRLGHHRWGFAQQDALPDIVVLGKPIGNGYPLAAVITTRTIADAFANGMEFFSTFGGSSVSCAAGHEVLRILDDENLARNAETVGTHLLTGLTDIATSTQAIGDVRGLGFFLGVEMIEPDGNQSQRKAAHIVNRLRERRILIGSDGPYDNVLKIRPPLCFSRDDADYLLENLSDIVTDDLIQDA